MVDRRARTETKQRSLGNEMDLNASLLRTRTLLLLLALPRSAEQPTNNCLYSSTRITPFQYTSTTLRNIERPMKIEIVVAPQPQSLASRVAPPATVVEAVVAPGPRTGGGRGRGRRGGARGSRKGDRPPKSAADLDAEMEDYTASNAPAAVAAA